ncbi:MAG TPA: hypothetical protein VFA71_15555 [Terriglobales bacterium]|nr:hypothetical protein [Terriglobales bacterium]
MKEKEEDLAALLASMLQDLPQVSVKKHVGHASFLAGKKVFAFTRDEGVAVKLPREKIQELVNKKSAAPLVMGKRVMKEWVVIKRKSAGEYKKDLSLFKEAVAFVSSLRK